MKPTALAISLALVAAMSCCGCKVQGFQYAQVGPQSHFEYPNSNVKPLGPVKVTGVRSIGDNITAQDEANLYNAALEQVHGANIIIDYVKIYRLYHLWPLPLARWWEMDLEGTAARMEIGAKDIGK